VATEHRAASLVPRSRWAILVVVLAAGGVIGALVKRDHDEQRRFDELAKQVAALEAAVSANAERTSPPTQVACSLDSQQLDAIRRVVAATTPASPPQKAKQSAAAAAEVTPEPPERTPEQLAALARADDLVDEGLRRRTLTRDDVVAIRRELAVAGNSGEEAQALRAKIAAAVSRGDLVPSGPHFIP
jgi:hypothetical protein